MFACSFPLSWASLVAQIVKRLPATQETQVRFLGLEDPLEKKMAPTPVFLPGKAHGQRSLAGYSPRGRERVRQDLMTKQQLLLLYYKVTSITFSLFLLFFS